jgi:hypothetical protein
LTMRARVLAPAAARSFAIKALLVGMIASRVHGQGPTSEAHRP